MRKPASAVSDSATVFWTASYSRKPISTSYTCWVGVSRLVYAAHLGVIEGPYGLAATAKLGPSGSDDDIMGPDGFRTSLLFQAGMPELRNDSRFPALRAGLKLVEFWIASIKWPDCAVEVPYDIKAGCARAQAIP